MFNSCRQTDSNSQRGKSISRVPRGLGLSVRAEQCGRGGGGGARRIEAGPGGDRLPAPPPAGTPVPWSALSTPQPFSLGVDSGPWPHLCCPKGLPGATVSVHPAQGTPQSTPALGSGPLPVLGGQGPLGVSAGWGWTWQGLPVQPPSPSPAGADLRVE